VKVVPESFKIETMQNNIQQILERNPIIPVVTIHSEKDIDRIHKQLSDRAIRCIEITLRTDYAFEAISEFKNRFGDLYDVGVGTIVNPDQIHRCVELKVDFMVSPALSPNLAQHLEHSETPFIPGVATPSEILRGMELGWRYFKFFPANLFGGLDALKAYSSVFREAKFCPTGGINEMNHSEYLALENVVSVGGTWLIK
jgi:2-dehydro-3-deoxyphosphogluconate aldolase/(4S)-4-hydroxy-2-oxoglutarate aldolase